MTVWLQDFDMAGCEGDARYRICLNSELPWHEGVTAGGPVLQAHDVWLLDASMRMAK
jgi:hypothetical protein